MGNDVKIFKEVKQITLNVLIAVTVFYVLDIFFKLSRWGYYYISEHSLVFSILISSVVFTLFWAMTKKTSKATAASYILIFVLGFINYFKMKFTDEPLYFSDINFLSNIGDISGLAFGNLSVVLILKIIGIFLMFAAVLYLIYRMIKKNDYELKSNKIRIAIVIIDIIILLFLFIPSAATKNLFLKVFFNISSYQDFGSYTTNRSYYNRHGFINGMYGVYLNNIFTEPEGYDEEALKKEIESVKVDTKTFGKPNVITVFSESMWDPTLIDEVKLNIDPLSEFKALKTKGKPISIISPAYGGMSENVAFEYLTGANLNYFTIGYIPVVSLYKRAGSENTPSIVKGFMDSGYTSEIIFAKDYYDSEKSYLKMGFEKFTELIEEDSDEAYVVDDYSVDALIDRLENKGDKPLFCMLSTIEAHMPFTDDRYENYEVKIESSELSDAENVVMKTFSQCMYNTDKAIKKLYDYIQEFDEPTILIVMSDHLPFLFTDDGNNIVEEANYFTTDDELVNCFRLYNTEGLVLANYDIQDMEVPTYLGVDQVLTTVANQLDINLDNYYKWLYTKKDVIAGTNRFVSFDKEGKLFETKEIESRQKEWFRKRDLMQYKYFINTK